MDDLKNILDRIRKPLVFASRNNFAHMQSLAAVEAFAMAQVEELKRLLPPSHTLEELEALFAGFDNAARDQKRERIARAAAILDMLEQGVHLAASGKNTSSAPQFSSSPTAISYSEPIQFVKGIGPKRARTAQKARHRIRSKTRCPIFPGGTRTGAI